MDRVTDNELRDFFAYVIETIEHLGIPDIVVDMKPADVAPFVERFPIPDYYVSEEAIRDSLVRRYPFNVIQPTTGAKIDLVPLPQDPFTRLAFQRRQRLALDESGRSAFFITPEDIIVAKLMAYRATGSDKHLRDARGVLLMQAGLLNLEAIRRLADNTGVLEILEDLLVTLPGDSVESS
jgi:hypothetical protein